MISKSMRERLLASSMIGGAALAGLAATSAAAQTAPAPPAAGAASEVQELVVTGSRIPQPNLTSVSPVQVVNAQAIAIGGRPNTFDILNQLPQTTFNAGADLGPSSDALSSAGGAATADLRGLGPQRTLVLVDGRRLGIGDPSTANPNSAPDLNQIPSQLIDRVEVLTGGASAVYGSDAVAGVVNFIMKHNFEGVQIDAQYGVNQHSQHNDFMQGLLRSSGNVVPDSKWDGKSVDYSLIFGANAPDGKGNIEGFITYHAQDPVYQDARDYSGCQLKKNFTCSGSSNSNILYPANGDLMDLDGDGVPESDAAAVLGHAFVPYGTPGTTPPAIFNANPYESLIQQDTRYTAGFFANYEINPSFDLYSNFSYMNDQSHIQIGPSALFQGSGVTVSGGYLVNCDSPLLSAQQATGIGCSTADVASGAAKELFFGRRNIEGGPRRADFEHDNYRIVVGTKGKLWGPFNYDLYGSYYYTSIYVANTGYLSMSKVQNALLVGGTAANPVCLSGGSCVPYNIFSDGGVTPAALDYLTESGTSHGSTTERIIEGTVTGDLSQWGIKSPWATDGVGVAAGFQSRRDHLTYAPDQAELSNDLSGFSGAAVAINNSLSVIEGYGEIRVPIAQDMPFMNDVSFNAGYRYSDYSTGITADTYKLGMEWAPTPDFRLRGGFNRAVRAPNIIELYTPLSVTNTSDVSSDPCAGATPTATLAECQRTGVTAAQYGHIPQCPADQCAVLQGGNTELQPERANTYTVGALFTPRFLPGFTGSIDYYHIDLKGIIGQFPLQVSMDQCIATGESTFCNNIVRNPANGIIFGTTIGGGYIVGPNINIAEEILKGYDVQMDYKLGFDTFGHDGWGSLVFSLNGSYQPSQVNLPAPGVTPYDCAGLFGPTCSGVFPKWRHSLRATWNAPHDLQLSATWRYIGGAEYEADSDQPTIGGNTTPDPIAHTVPAVNYLDLAATWNVNEKLTLRGGVNNIFDRDPPLIENAIVGGALPNSYPTYDLLGRHLFVALTARF